MKLLLAFISITFSLAAHDQQAVIARIHAHTLLGDTAAAVEEGKGALKRMAPTAQLMEAYISALAADEQHAPMLEAWGEYTTLNADAYDHRHLIEQMAWSEIYTAYRSTSPVIRLTALVAAAYSDDARGVALLSRGLKDSNSFIRTVVLKLACRFRDVSLCEKVAALFYHERIPAVRWEAVRTLGQMGAHAMKRPILTLLADEATEDVGKVAAIQAIVALDEDVTHDELLFFIHSPRAGLRQLACELVSSFDLDGEMILPLLNDPQPSVRAAAVRTLGLIRTSTLQGYDRAAWITPLLNDSDYEVAITAAWAMTLVDPSVGQQQLRRWLASRKQEVRLLAAAALAATGQYGQPLIVDAFTDATRDPFIQLTLAYSMISQRESVDAAANAIGKWLTLDHDRWMWQEYGHFRAIAPSKVKHNAAIPHYPEAVNQMVRLELLNALAIVAAPNVEVSLREFLSERGWGISSTASALLLTEGDDSAIDVVEELLSSDDASIQTQAALILALWGRGEAAVEQLQNSYATASRDLKERILEGVGSVALASSVPFLIDKLREPYPTLRIIAASSLLQCLNH